MADEADMAQDRIDTERELSVARIRESIRNAPINISGLCEDCDNPVGEERLRHLPTASRCIHCQTAYELESRR